MPFRWPDAVRVASACAALLAITVVYLEWLRVSNATIVALTFLLIVLVVAATSRLLVAATTAVIAMLCFNFFFLPPVRTFAIADPENLVALFVFLAVSLVASNLSSVARRRTEEALGRRDELTRLFDLSRDVLLMTEGREALPTLARTIARRFDLRYVALCLPRSRDWDRYEAGSTTVPVDRHDLDEAFSGAQPLEFDARARTYAGHRSIGSGTEIVRLVPLRAGARPIGLLAAAGRPIEPGTLDALAGVVAIAIERVRFLEERHAAELTRRSDELKTTLLASLGHDLRTPLTAIRLAATNLEDPQLGEAEKREQAELVLSEIERLTRLFENILDMARIDAAAVSTDMRWVHPSEIITAARDQVEQTLRRHRLDVHIDPDLPVRLDPRLTATAVAHLLENAAQYGPPDSTIHVSARTTSEGLVIEVRDHGPGITPADMPHLFERFYRGADAQGHASGTGLGLSITRGLLAAEHGRIWVENCDGGGAQFTVAVPSENKLSTPGGQVPPS
jgi:two-component system sensor histidine kinase KdpD